jgi:hypothetical protein
MDLVLLEIKQVVYNIYTARKKTEYGKRRDSFEQQQW